MIRQEHFTVGDRDFVRTTSDSGRYVVRDGVKVVYIAMSPSTEQSNIGQFR